MKNIFLFAILLLIGISSSNAQTWQWAKQEAGWNMENCWNGTTDNFGNTFIILKSYADITIDGTLYCCGGSILIKYSSTGNLLWARQICVHSTVGIAIDNSGNCVVTGRAMQGNAFENGMGGYDTIMATDGLEAFLVKYSPTGNLLWHTNYNPSASAEYAEDIVADAGGFLYTIVSANPPFASQYFIAKFDPSGNLIWEIPTDIVQYVALSQIVVDASSNVYVQGGTSAPISLGGYLINPSDSVEMFIVKIDSLGNILWVKENFGHVQGSDMNITPSGNIILSGKSSSNPTTIGSVTIQGDDWFIAKFDSSGNNIWVKSTSALQTNSAIYNESIYLSGIFYDSVSFYQNAITLYTNNTLTFFIAQMDSSGNIQWTTQNNSSVGAMLHLRNIDSDPSGNIIISGMFSDSLSFGTTSFVCTDTTPNRRDVFVAKFSVPLTTEINDSPNNSGLTIYPNPSSGSFSVNLKNTTVVSQICVYDLLGNCLQKKACRNDASPKIDLSSQPKGVYFMEIVSDRERVVKKIVLQ